MSMSWRGAGVALNTDTYCISDMRREPASSMWTPITCHPHVYKCDRCVYTILMCTGALTPSAITTLSAPPLSCIQALVPWALALWAASVTENRKTTLIKALTGDNTIRPQDRLFATLDVTAHAGWLPSRVAVIYMDTISFLSQLPHSLIESFSATLEDVAHSDLVVHVRDVSRPETELQKASVPAALRGLRLPASLLDSVLEIHNKVDLVPGYSPAGSQAVAMSALLGHGLPELRAQLEDAVLRATGRQVLMLRVRLAGAQLSWLHQEATVQDVDLIPDAGAANVRVVISSSAYSKFQKLFLESASQPGPLCREQLGPENMPMCWEAGSHPKKGARARPTPEVPTPRF
ncbi:putative GTP-binding protein 6 [Puma concolor]|uniref:GTP-binding protein 6 n=1 Tax=Puma concolor TaxID=9696 RepID=A0A6P6IQB9_PUMCO|nr:putative GTP-binding protein 6 [Puma concolor]